MIFLLYSYFWCLVFLNLLGTYTSQTVHVPSPGSDNATTSVTLAPAGMQRFFIEKNQLIREVNADVKTLLRYFPGVSDNLTTTTRSLVEMKSVLYGCMNEIKEIRTDVALIKFHTMYLPKNLTRMSRKLDRRDKIIMQRMSNGTETLAGGITALGKYYTGMLKDYRAIKRDVTKLKDLIANISIGLSCPAVPQPGGQITPQPELTMTPNLDVTMSPQVDLPVTHPYPVHPLTFPPMMEHQLNTSIAKLNDLLFGQEQIKNKIDQGIARLDDSIIRLEQKLDSAFDNLDEETKLIHERVISDIEKVMQQISELKDIMTSATSQPPTSPIGKKFKVFLPRKPHTYHTPLPPTTPTDLPRLTLAQMLQFWSLVRRATDIFDRIVEKKPVVGLGGAIGLGRLIEAPDGFPDYSGVLGGISGIALVPNEELRNLGDLILELPEILGIPIPPLSELPTWLENNVGEPIGTPRPAANPAMPGREDTIENPTILPTEKPGSWFDWFLPDLTQSTDVFPEVTEGPEIVEPVPDLPVLPPPKPTLPAVPEIPYIPEIVPEPTQPPPLKPEPHPPIIPGIYPTQPTQPPTAPPIAPPSPEPPTLLTPVTVFRIPGLENHCACSCPCDCTCPILPIEFPKTSTKQWWSEFRHVRIHSKSPKCKCLCACPCPREYAPQTPKPNVAEDEADTERPPWSLPEDDSSHDYGDAMTTHRWQTPKPTASSVPNNKSDYCCKKIDDLSNQIKELSDDFHMLKITVRDEMVITREAIMTQMNEKFQAVAAALAGTHYTNVLLHSNDKNATDNVGQMVKGQFTRTYHTLRGVTETVSRMRAAVQTMLRSHYNGMMKPEPPDYDTYWQMRHPYKNLNPFFRRSSPDESAKDSSFPEIFHEEIL